MTRALTDPEAAFEAGQSRCCAGQRKDWPLPAASTEPQRLREFVWKPPEDKPSTRSGREIERLLTSIRTIASDEGGRNFVRLMEDAKYAATYEHGYSNGSKDGKQWALERWRAEYAEVLSALVQRLGAHLKEPDVLPALTAAVVYEEMLVPLGLEGEGRNPKFREVLKFLRGDVTSDAGVQPELTPEDAEALEAAQWTYRAGLLTNEISLLDLFALADVAVSEWLSDMREELEEMLSVLVGLNGDPCAQGYFAGWYLAVVTVQTVRSIIETGVELGVELAEPDVLIIKP